MLGKLFKYDFQALGRVLLPVQLILLATSVLAAVISTVLLRSSVATYSYLDSSYTTTNPSGISSGLIVLIYMMMVAIVFAAGVMTVFFIARHFYQSIFSSEGYLTMTLPVSTYAHVQSKTLAGFVWIIVNVLVMLLAGGVMMFFGTAYEGLINREAAEGLFQVFRHLIDVGAGILLFEYPLSYLISTLSALLCLFACITIGCAIANKHKIAMAILFIFIIWLVTATLGGILQMVVVSLIMPGVSVGSGASSMITMVMLGAGIDYFMVLEIQEAVTTVLNGIYIVVYVFIIHRIIKTSLNLE